MLKCKHAKTWDYNMETFKPKCINSNFIEYGVKPLRLGG